MNPGVNKFTRVYILFESQVKCPKNCVDIDEAIVYGNGPFAS